MPTFMLPCACGNQIQVEPTDAGLMVTCSCGASVKVPNKRSIFALPRLTTGAPDDSAETAARWGLRNQLLTAGLVCLLLGGIATSYLIYTRPTNPAEAMAEFEIGRMPINVLVGLWQQFQDGFQPIDTPVIHIYEQKRDENVRLTWVAGAVMGGGAAMLLAALMTGKNRR